MTFSWNELVCHGLLKKVGEPSLAREIFRYAKKMNRDYLEEEAREFHTENVGPVINIYMSALRRPRGAWAAAAAASSFSFAAAAMAYPAVAAACSSPTTDPSSSRAFSAVASNFAIVTCASAAGAWVRAAVGWWWFEQSFGQAHIKYNNVKKELRWWWWEGGGRSQDGRWVLFN